MGGASVLAEVLGRDDRPASLRGPRRRVGTGTYVQHRSNCSAAWGSEEPLTDRFLLSGCVRCTNTAEVSDALRVAWGVSEHLLRVTEAVAEALEEEGGSPYALSSVRAQGDPTWNAGFFLGDARIEGDLREWARAVVEELVRPVFAAEPYSSVVEGDVTVLVATRTLFSYAPDVVVKRAPHRLFSAEWSDLALVSLSEPEVSSLEDGAARAAKPMRTRLPLETLLSEEFGDVWTLALEVLSGAPSENVDLDEVLEVSRRAALR